MTSVVIDTNVFVAAGFNSRSASARILSLVSAGELRMIWNEQTRRETKFILEKIPPLSWGSAAELFRDEHRCNEHPNTDDLDLIPDLDDRKFAALARASAAVLLTNDSDLLDHRHQMSIQILTPGEFWDRHGDDANP